MTASLLPLPCDIGPHHKETGLEVLKFQNDIYSINYQAVLTKSKAPLYHFFVLCRPVAFYASKTPALTR